MIDVDCDFRIKKADEGIWPFATMNRPGFAGGSNS